MKSRNSIIAGTALALGVALGAADAEAASVSIFLDQTNKQGFLPAETDFLKVTISDGADGDIDFLVETLPTLKDFKGKSQKPYGIDAFSFNFGSSGARLGNIELPYDWNYGAPDQKDNPFGIFDATLSTNKKSQRTDYLEFSITDVDGDSPFDYLQDLSLGEAPLGNYQFQVNFGGLGLGKQPAVCRDDHPGKAKASKFSDPEFCAPRGHGISDAKFAGGTSVVPIPAAAWLFGSGLLGLIGMGRRRFRAKATAAAR